MPSRTRHRFSAACALSLVVFGVGLVGTAGGQPIPPARLTPASFDALVIGEAPALGGAAAGDEQFLRRASFDLVGRPPTLDEQRRFAADRSAEKHHNVIERLLASDEFGANWADYWTDTIAYRVPPPELTYLNYRPLKRWLTEQLNANTPWDKITRELLTARGKIEEQPAATFVGYHQANATNLAAETSRVFLGQQIGCAQCHDHPFDNWKRTQFHELAAFFARTKSKLSQNDGAGTVVSSAAKGEYLMRDAVDPHNKGTEVRPAFLDSAPRDIGASDEARRAKLAAWVASHDNPWFAKAYVNRIWGRLMGRGFYEPVDDLGDSRTGLWPEVHEALARHFAESGFDTKELLRLIMNSQAYRTGPRSLAPGAPDAGSSDEWPWRLRGDEVFAALKVGLELPDITPPETKPTAAVRFPPPPKSTRDMVNGTFGSDPSLTARDVPRTITQALWMMNNEQLQRQISAAKGSGTMLAKLLESEPDNAKACEQLFSRVLARAATADETKIALAHIAAVGDRCAGFEDLLWSLVNSAEFTARR